MKYLFILFMAFVLLTIGGFGLWSYYITDTSHPSLRGSGGQGGGHVSSVTKEISEELKDQKSKGLATRRSSVVGLTTKRNGYVVYVCRTSSAAWAVIVNESIVPPLVWKKSSPPSRRRVEAYFHKHTRFITWASFPRNYSRALNWYLQKRRKVSFSGKIKSIYRGQMIMVNCRNLKHASVN